MLYMLYIYIFTKGLGRSEESSSHYALSIGKFPIGNHRNAHPRVHIGDLGSEGFQICSKGWWCVTFLNNLTREVVRCCKTQKCMRKNTWSNEHEGKRIWSCIYAGGILCQFLKINKSHGFCFVFVLLAPPNGPTLVQNLGFAGSSTEHRQHHYLHDRLGQGHIWFRIAISGHRKWPLTKSYCTKNNSMDYPPRNTHICLEIPRKKVSIFWKLQSIQSWWMAIRIPACDILDDQKMTNDKWYSRVESSCESPAHSVDGRNPPVDSVDR